MLFYRGVNLIILSFEFYFLLKIRNYLGEKNESLDFIGMLGQILISVNLFFGVVFFLAELFLSRESPTLSKVKASYPYTETPIKIALLSTIGVSALCGIEDPNLYALLDLIRTDLILSYLSYAWKTFWPIIIVPTNKILMYINAVILYIFRFIRGLCFFFHFD